MEFPIVSLTSEHLPQMVEIERQCYGLPWSRAMFEGELLKQDAIVLGALDLPALDAAEGAPADLTLVGYLVVSPYGEVWHIMNIAVRPQVRRHGVARALLRSFFERLPAGTPRSYTLEVRRSNEAAIRLYEEFGFVREGVRPGYYVDNREDAIVMWRRDVSDRLSAAR